MPTDVLVLGGFVFEGFAAPEKLPGGGRQRHTVQRMAGGLRVIDAWGPDDRDRSWSGTFWGEGALDNALTLDAMRASGAELPYSNGVESRTVIIGEFHFEVRKVQCVEYQITLVTADDSGTGAGGGFGGFGGLLGAGLSSIDGIVGADLFGAIGIAGGYLGIDLTGPLDAALGGIDAVIAASTDPLGFGLDVAATALAA